MTPETKDIILWFGGIVFPWAVGISYLFAKAVTWYENWLWKGMNDEKRFTYIKVPRW